MNTKAVKSKNIRASMQRLQSSLTLIVVAATVISVFFLASAKALLSQASYQNHVISKRHAALKQLQANVSAGQQLVDQYNNVFENSGPTNAIGGKNDSSPNAIPPDGDNARIVLDALPITYDFPGLVTSMSKVLTADNIQNPSIGGSDQSVTAVNTPSNSPQPVSIDVPISGTTTYAGLQKLIGDLERSVRPFNITNVSITGSASSLTFTLQASTYYQPAKTLDINWGVVKK